MGLCAGRERRGLVGEETLGLRDRVGEAGVYTEEPSLWSRDGLRDLDRSRGVGRLMDRGDRTFGFKLALRTILTAEVGEDGLIGAGRDGAGGVV